MVQKIISKSQEFFAKKNSSILSAAVIIGISFLASALLGLLRNRLLASRFFGGQEALLDVYFAAFVVPDTIFQLFIVGALSASFIPFFQESLQRSKEDANRLTQSVLSLTFFVLAIFSLIVFVFAYPISNLITHFPHEQLLIMANLIKIMSLAQIIFATSSVFTGVLQAEQKFLIPSLAPILYNLGTVLGVYFFSSSYGIYSAAIGVIFGALMHSLIQVPSVIKSGITPKIIFNHFHPGLSQMLRLMPGRTLSLSLDQIQRWVSVNLSSLLLPGSLSMYTFARQLYILPVTLFGVSLSQATFPSLAKDALLSDKSVFKNTLIKSLLQIFFFSLPAAVLILVLRIPLVRIVFGAKSFPWGATLDTGLALAILSISIPALAVTHTLTRALHALKDTKTPLLSGFISVCFYSYFAYILVKRFDLGIVGLSLALSVSNLLDFIITYILLTKKIGNLGIGKKLFKMLSVTALTGFSLWLPMRLLDAFVFDTTRTIPLIVLTLVVSTVGFGVYLLFCRLTKVEELSEVINIVRKLGNWRKILASSDEVIDGSTTNT